MAILNNKADVDGRGQQSDPDLIRRDETEPTPIVNGQHRDASKNRGTWPQWGPEIERILGD